MRYLSGAAAVVYVVFAIACFRLIWIDEDWDLALGEGLFTLFGGVALVWATVGRRHRPAVAIAGTLPLVGWFVATPYNSGPPFLVASLFAPFAAVAAWIVTARRAA